MASEVSTKVATRIGLKTYLEITAISKPPEAEEGDWVYVGVQVRNKHTTDIYVTVTGTFDGIPSYPLGGASFVVKAGDYQWWPLHFTMPNKSVTGTVRAYYWSVDGWIKDDEQTFSVALAGAPPVELTGRIENPRIKYNLSYVPIPQEVDFGENFRIAFTGRNTSSITLQLGGGIAVTDPDGNIVCQEFDWESFPYTGANGTHDFSFPKDSWKNLTIPVNKYGTWRAAFELYGWDGTTSVKLARIEAVIFTVEAVELTGRIESPRIKYNLSYVSVYPVKTVPYGENFRVAFTGRNTSSVNVKLWGKIHVYDPDGNEVLVQEDWEGVEGLIGPGQYTGPNGTHNFSFPMPTATNPNPTIPVNMAGEWKARMILAGWDMVSEDTQILDDITVTLFNVLPEEEKYVGEITNQRVDLKPLWPGGEYPLPYTAKPVEVGQGYNIGFYGWNRSDFAMRLKGEILITSPTGREWHQEYVTPLIYTPNTMFDFIFDEIPLVDEEGTWTVRMELRNSTGEHLLAEWEGILFSTEILLKGDVFGYVTDAETGLPIEEAVVTVDETGQSDTASIMGIYLIKDVPQGTYTLTARATGYESATESDVTITSGKITFLDFMLVKAVAVGIPSWIMAAGAIGGAAAIGAAIYFQKKKKKT